MTLDLDALTRTYYELSSLYKNPTRTEDPVSALNGKAASNRDAELAEGHRRLLAHFNKCKPVWIDSAEKPAIYFKLLALLYEIDDYRAAPSSVSDLIRREWELILDDMKTLLYPKAKNKQAAPLPAINFKDPKVRPLWKAKVLCGVAAVEARRKATRLDSLLDELNVLETFINEKLHLPGAGLPSWTMLAFVRAAQARVARQNQAYEYVQEKLLSVVECLDERAAEIINKLIDLEQSGKVAGARRVGMEDLTDDLIFIRQKQTLASLFNVGLANLQRGFLKSADYACQAARLQFRLHGQFLHRMYNELVILSIKRARLSAENKEELCALHQQLKETILPLLKPAGETGNLKLYLYGLREMAVIQYSCGETGKMLRTISAMERVGPLSSQWAARVSILRARYCYQHWRHCAEGSRDDRLLARALKHSEAAFKSATKLPEGIRSQRDTKQLLSRIKGSVNKSLIDTIESLITYGTAQLFLGNPSEAAKSANAVVELSLNDNPRLLAMGYLVLAEAYVQKGLNIKARQYLASAKSLESQIDHKYVEDRRRAVEGLMPKYLDLTDVEKFDDAEDLLLGWFIEHRSDKTNVNKVSSAISKNRKTIKSYLQRLRKPENRHSPYRHLVNLEKKTGRKSQS